MCPSETQISVVSPRGPRLIFDTPLAPLALFGKIKKIFWLCLPLNFGCWGGGGCCNPCTASV